MLDDRDRTVSSARFDAIGIRDSGSNVMGWTARLGERYGTEDVSCYAAPARVTELTGLPPAFVECGRPRSSGDEDIAYARACSPELHIWPAGFHGFDLIAPHTGIARAVIATGNEWIARSLDAAHGHKG
ncbi:hypothetical protein [Saccharopolyspora montiporae]|uniref:hypothetical protein n=1 Tax=Saccharopolyspora montiporae TaxID=2781240 RepID=UPI001D14C62E|nr:hypothetical protein [Saccharopolyspora sp. HNM0983]